MALVDKSSPGTIKITQPPIEEIVIAKNAIRSHPRLVRSLVIINTQSFESNFTREYRFFVPD